MNLIKSLFLVFYTLCFFSPSQSDLDLQITLFQIGSEISEGNSENIASCLFFIYFIESFFSFVSEIEESEERKSPYEILGILMDNIKKAIEDEDNEMDCFNKEKALEIIPDTLKQIVDFESSDYLLEIKTRLKDTIKTGSEKSKIHILIEFLGFLLDEADESKKHLIVFIENTKPKIENSEDIEALIKSEEAKKYLKNFNKIASYIDSSAKIDFDSSLGWYSYDKESLLKDIGIVEEFLKSVKLQNIFEKAKKEDLKLKKTFITKNQIIQTDENSQNNLKGGDNSSDKGKDNGGIGGFGWILYGGSLLIVFVLGLYIGTFANRENQFKYKGDTEINN